MFNNRGQTLWKPLLVKQFQYLSYFTVLNDTHFLYEILLLISTLHGGGRKCPQKDLRRIYQALLYFSPAFFIYGAALETNNNAVDFLSVHYNFSANKRLVL